MFFLEHNYILPKEFIDDRVENVIWLKCNNVTFHGYPVLI